MKGTMTTESKTPETDREMFHCEDNVGRLETHVHVDFARQLELSRDEWSTIACELAAETYMLRVEGGYIGNCPSLTRFRELQQKEHK
jgi:hypothetical protein